MRTSTPDAGGLLPNLGAVGVQRELAPSTVLALGVIPAHCLGQAVAAGAHPARRTRSDSECGAFTGRDRMGPAIT
jgi:hypothetical protein